MVLFIGVVIILGFLGDIFDVFIIFFIVLFIGLLSFFQERNVGKVVEKFQLLVFKKVMVFCDGKEQVVKLEQIVKGDVIILNVGDMLLVDCFIIEVNELYVNEFSLMGEFYLVRKEVGVVDENVVLLKRINCFWEGMNIVSGYVKVIVIQIGEDILFGSLVKSVL